MRILREQRDNNYEFQPDGKTPTASETISNKNMPGGHTADYEFTAMEFDERSLLLLSSHRLRFRSDSRPPQCISRPSAYFT